MRCLARMGKVLKTVWWTGRDRASQGDNAYPVIPVTPFTALAPGRAQLLKAPNPQSKPMELWLGLVLLFTGLALGAILGRVTALRGQAADKLRVRVVAGVETPDVVIKTGGFQMGPGYLVEELFLLSPDGRMMVHMGQMLEESDMVGSMLTAITDFVHESFGHQGYLGAIDHGDNRILVESGRWARLAVVIYGSADEALRDLMNSTVALIEAHLQEVIEKWDGDLQTVRRARELLSPIIQYTAGVTRDQVQASTHKAGIRLKTGWEFIEGFVQLQVKIINNTPTALHSCRMTLAHDPARLTLAGVEPSKLPLRSGVVSLGQLLAHSETEMLLILDLLECGSIMVELNLLYQTSALEAHQMVSRQLELICPASFNPYNANPAMARRYLQSSLPHRDANLLPLPGNLTALDFFHQLRFALAQLEVLSVSERRSDVPSIFEGWYTTLDLPSDGVIRGPLPFLFKPTLRLDEGTLELMLATPSLEDLEIARRLTIEPLQRTLDDLSAQFPIEVS